ncbi:pyruvate decarboxylase (predicted) [Pochonia chlamydosporia 170]|uniref:Pyruvate decarboxylase n=1 Tax=Pochonia chlamydosporia 170 TaxID=1380566 RepID=A0A179F3I8_METCM|nr:pyruvate decarboxylase (predicted) [Pochonia chlamydosporia 170]OAQ59689.1 pyruvate decarboxylase (predicted) [Pochonia chlamydosporia 170]
MAVFTVADYIAERLAQIGIRHHFLVPGDYNLTLLDKLEEHPSLTGIGCTNELNCSLAAEGYARANGIGACVVTYSVGAFSAFNGIGSAYAENLPVILISGAPNTNDADRHLLHHTLAEYDFTYQFEMAKKVTCSAAAIRNSKSAPESIDRVIQACLRQHKPGYIELPTNLASETCVRPGPIGGLAAAGRQDESVLLAAVTSVAEYIEAKQKPVILAGPKVRGSKVQKNLVRLAEAIGCAVVVQPAGKGLFPETHPQFAGVFWGQVSTLAADSIVNWSDVLICVGTIFTDYSTVGWTAVSNVPGIIIDVDAVTCATTHFSGVRIRDFLASLADAVSWNENSMAEYSRLRPELPVLRASSYGELTRREVARRLQELLDPDTTVFADTGDSWFNGVHLQLPLGAGFEIEMQWGHIGWSIPASFGYALARPKRKLIVMIGDGAFQVTAQEISQMVRHRTPIILVLMNNKGYTIEAEIHDGVYNRIHNWNYVLLVQAFNSSDSGGRALALKADTTEEFSEVIRLAQAHKDGPSLIECSIEQDDCSKELITWGHYVAAANSRSGINI